MGMQSCSLPIWSGRRLLQNATGEHGGDMVTAIMDLKGKANKRPPNPHPTALLTASNNLK